MDQLTYNTLSDDDKVEALKELSAGAEAAGMSKCLMGEAVFFAQDSQGRIPGHIYSYAGQSEFRISGTCEYHFDNMFREPDVTDEVEVETGKWANKYGAEAESPSMEGFQIWLLAQHARETGIDPTPESHAKWLADNKINLAAITARDGSGYEPTEHDRELSQFMRYATTRGIIPNPVTLAEWREAGKPEA